MARDDYMIKCVIALLESLNLAKEPSYLEWELKDYWSGSWKRSKL